MPELTIAIVGSGQRSRKRAIATIHAFRKDWRLIAACDPNSDACQDFTIQYPKIPTFPDVHKMIQWSRHNSRINCAYVAVPHHYYVEVVPLLLEAGISVLKEKPAAASFGELIHFHQIADMNSVRLVTAGQLRYGKRLAQIRAWMPLIGTVHTIEAERKLSIMDLSSGWRASTKLSGGGVLGDLGWHSLDEILSLVPENSLVHVVYARMFHVRAYQGHDCEESADVIIELEAKTKNSISAHLTVSRIGHDETNKIIITGEDGVIAASGEDVSLQKKFRSGERTSHSAHARDEVSSFDRMFKRFHDENIEIKKSQPYFEHQLRDLKVTETLSRLYQHAEMAACGHPKHSNRNNDQSIVGLQQAQTTYEMKWPVIDSDLEHLVTGQLKKGISIYGNDGVFQTFETEFKAYHNMMDCFALLHNSGTNALHALHFAAQLRPDHEVD